jgi:hypothetical protein
MRNRQIFNQFLPILLSMLYMLLLAVPSMGQDVRGSISGTIVDPVDAAVPGAKVTITNIETNVSTTSTTNDEGVYTALFLNPGSYTITVEANGYKKTVQENIQVRVEDKLVINLKLELGAVSEVVNITDATTLLQPGEASVGQVLDSQLISELPTPDGNPYLLSHLAAGVIDTAEDPEFTRPHDTINTSRMEVNGINNGNEFSMDNLPNTQSGGKIAFTPSSDAVEEFKISTNFVDAQNGRASGAVINIATKSGKNTPFGTFSYTGRNEVFAANKFFSNRDGIPRNALRYHRAGATVGGPVMLPRFGEGGPRIWSGRNKTFFFFAYDFLKDSFPDNNEDTLYNVPTEKMRRGDLSELFTYLPNGDKAQRTTTISSSIGNRANCGGWRTGQVVPLTNLDNSPAYIGQIYDPKSARSVRRCNPLTGNVDTLIERLPFENNIIPLERFSPFARTALQYFPLPNTSGRGAITDNFYSPVPNSTTYQSQTIRIDHKYNDSHNAFVRFTHSGRDNLEKSWTGMVNGIYPTGRTWNRASTAVAYDHVYNITPTTVLNLRGGVSYFTDAFTVPSKGQFDVATLGFSERTLSQFQSLDYFPEIAVADYSSIGRSLDGPLTHTTYVFQPSLTKLIGGHNIRAGYDLRVYRENAYSGSHAAGRYTFNETYVKGPTQNSSDFNGQGFAAFLLGIGGGSIQRGTSRAAQTMYHAFFVQNDWKVNRKLTLNLGLRYEYEGATTERFNRAIRGFDPTSPTSPTIQAEVFDNLRTHMPGYIKDSNNPKNPAPKPISLDIIQKIQERGLKGGLLFADQNNRGLWEPEKNKFLPRLGVAYALNDKTVFRAGLAFMAGSAMLGLRQVGFSQTTNMVTTQDSGLTFIDLSDPYPLGVIEPRGSSAGLATLIGEDLDDVIIPDERKSARIQRWNIGIQREIWGRVMVEANYVGSRIRNLAVSRNINSISASEMSTSPFRDDAVITRLDALYTNPFRGAIPGSQVSLFTKADITLAELLRPYPHFGAIDLPRYDGKSDYNAAQFKVQKRFSRGSSGFFTYTWSKQMEERTLRNPTDTSYEKRIAGGDRPHRITFGGFYELPFGRKRHWGSEWNSVVNGVLGGWQLGATYIWQTGAPIDLGRINYYNGDLGELRVNVSSKQVLPRSTDRINGQRANVYNNVLGTDLTKLGFYPGVGDPAFQLRLPDPADPKKLVPVFDAQGNPVWDFNLLRTDSRINYKYKLRTFPTRVSWLRGASRSSINLSLKKKFYFGEKGHFELRGEAINATNTPQFDSINFDPRNENFGTINTQRNMPRFFQLGARIVW